MFMALAFLSRRSRVRWLPPCRACHDKRWIGLSIRGLTMFCFQDHTSIASLATGICNALERRILHGVPYGSAAEVLHKCVIALGASDAVWLRAAQLLAMVSSHLARLHFEGEDNSIDDIIKVNSHMAYIVRTGSQPPPGSSPPDPNSPPYRIPRVLQETLVTSRHAVEGLVQTSCICREECRELLRAAQWDCSPMSRAVVESLYNLIVNEGSSEALERVVSHIVELSVLNDRFVGDRAKVIVKHCWRNVFEPYGETGNAKRLVLLEIARRITLRCQDAYDEMKNQGKTKIRDVYTWLGKLSGVPDQRKQDLRDWLSMLVE